MELQLAPPFPFGFVRLTVSFTAGNHHTGKGRTAVEVTENRCEDAD
jgi:hypothetical protein